MKQNVGMIAGLRLEHFGTQELEISNNLGAVWFVGGSGVQTAGAKARYPYLFLKPTDTFRERFNLHTDLLCIFHPFSTIDGRVLGAIDRLLSANPYRLDRLSVVLISNADTIDDAISRSDADSDVRIIIPFRYKELVGGAGGKESLMIQRFEQSLYTKDLFAISSVLKSDRHFYGRKAELQRIVGQYKNGENGSLFGLRRIGKTSLLWAVLRHLKADGTPVAFIDCSDPAFHRATWNKTLFRVKQALFAANDLDNSGHQEAEYSEEDATICFANDLKEVKSKFSKPSLIIFDEIESLCFEVASSEHWKNGSNFMPFWQAIRSTFQQHPYVFSFLVCGTNPYVLETARLPNGLDNPIYKYLEPSYLGFFDLDDVQRMITHMSGYMGISFDTEIFTYLTDDYGGHPFLIRQVCSYLRSKSINPDFPRKLHIRKSEYQNNRDAISAHTRNYVELILEILTARYPKEYSLLKYLAAGDPHVFNIHADADPTLVEHLLGYGLIERSSGQYCFRLKVIEAAVRHDARDLTCPDSLEERWALISKERNQFEFRLRELVRQTLKMSLGTNDGKKIMLECMTKSAQRAKAEALTFDGIFKGELYFLDLKMAILKNWANFRYAFNDDKPRFSESVDAANKYRSDAHAKTITREEFRSVMPKLVWLNRQLEVNT